MELCDPNKYDQIDFHDFIKAILSTKRKVYKQQVEEIFEKYDLNSIEMEKKKESAINTNDPSVPLNEIPKGNFALDSLI